VEGSGEELDGLHEELRSALREFEQLRGRWTSVNVISPIGPRGLRHFQMGPLLISYIVNLGNLTCFATGLVFAFLGGAISTVGIALLVGALFSEGAFLGQAWTITAQSEYAMSERLWGDEFYTHLMQLKEKIIALSDRVEDLQGAAAEATNEEQASLKPVDEGTDSADA
jgi:hypothetical protein